MTRFAALLAVIVAMLALAAPALADTQTFTATEDTWVRSDQPSSTAGANADTLWSQSQVTGSGARPAEVAALKFNLDPLPDDATVTDLDLTLKARSGSDKPHAGTSNGPRVELTTNNWTEGSATYPVITGLTLGGTVANIGAVSTGATVSVDLDMGTTPGGTPSFRLAPEGDDLGVWSSEAGTAANRPQLVVTYTVPPPPPPADADGDGVIDANDQCPGTPAGTQVTPNGCPVVTPPPGGGQIPANAVLVRQNDHNGSGPVSTSQCPSGGTVTEQDGYLRLYRPAGAGQAAGGFRCEIQWGSNIAPGEEHWITYRARYPIGMAGSTGWRAGFQVHEANVNNIGAVDAAMFYEGSGFVWYGQAASRTNVFTGNVADWHTYTVRFVASTGSSGRIEFWVDGVAYGASTGRNMTAGGNSYIKYGHYGRDDVTREAQFDYVRHYRLP